MCLLSHLGCPEISPVTDARGQEDCVFLGSREDRLSSGALGALASKPFARLVRRHRQVGKSKGWKRIRWMRRKWRRHVDLPKSKKDQKGHKIRQATVHANAMIERHHRSHSPAGAII